jgi:signal transduction histidine kinase/ActR/RegA family two-component response regulator
MKENSKSANPAALGAPELEDQWPNIAGGGLHSPPAGDSILRPSTKLLLMGSVVLLLGTPLLAHGTVKYSTAVYLPLSLFFYATLKLQDRGYKRLAAWTLCGGLFSAVVLGILFFGGIKAQSAVVFSTVIIMAALNIGGRAAIFFGLLSALAVVALVQADAMGLTPTPLVPITPKAILSSTLLNLGIVAVVMRRSVQQLKSAQAQLEESELRQDLYGHRLEKIHAQTRERARFARAISDISESVIHSDFNEWRPRAMHTVRDAFDALAVGLYQTSTGSNPHLTDWSGEDHQKARSACNALAQAECVPAGEAFSRLTREKNSDAFYDFGEEIKTALIISIPGRTHSQAQLIVLLSGDVDTNRALAKDIQTLRSIIGSSMERAAAEQKMRVAQRMETVGRLAGSVAHDFNNLLTTIMGCSQLLMDDERKNENDVELLSDIVRAADHAALLTRKLLVLSRKQVVLASPVDLGKATQDFCRMADRMVGENIEVEFNPPRDEACILADPSNVEQILLNLTVNARDAMPGGGKIGIDLGRCSANDPRLGDVPTELRGNFVELNFTDTGSGMSEHVLEHLFEPFFTTKKSGTGLGLASVRKILEDLGGFIRVSSSPLTGTEFSIFFPEEKASAPENEQKVGFTDWPGNGESILLVDDNDHVRKTLKKVLKQAGYQVSLAHGGLGALRTIEKSTIDFQLILTDIIMPNISGIEFANTLRGRGNQTPIVFMSGFADSTEAEVRGMGDFIAKPFTSSDLLARIRLSLQKNISIYRNQSLPTSPAQLPERTGLGP